MTYVLRAIIVILMTSESIPMVCMCLCQLNIVSCSLSPLEFQSTSSNLGTVATGSHQVGVAGKIFILFHY